MRRGYCATWRQDGKREVAAVPDILSVGIDIGTSTTQVVFSKLTMENTSGYFTVPRVAIVDKTVVYKSDVYMTPLLDDVRIDTKAVHNIVAAEFDRSGFSPEDTDSGAVIITGESARKENADAVLAELSDFAGDFVVSAAGPDMESVIAGKGSGAYAYSMKNHSVAANLDIGGGTTNIVVFDDGKTVAKGCFDIGGRLICVSGDMTVIKLSPAAQRAAAAAGAAIERGRRTDQAALEKITGTMAGFLCEVLKGKRPPLYEDIRTPGSSEFIPPQHIDAVFFSGGVADSVYHKKTVLFEFGDIGTMLGQAVAKAFAAYGFKTAASGETIRATVIGAGTYTTTISGSTIFYTQNLFPLKNIPVLLLDSQTESACYTGDGRLLEQKVRWFMAQNDAPVVMLAMDGLKNPSYNAVKAAAAVIAEVMDRCLENAQPVIVVIKNDMAKALGQLIHQYFSGRRPAIVIDSIDVAEGDYVDMGHPVMDGLVIPVVVKTLIFG